MKSELDTLFLPFTDGLVEWPAKGKVLFANAKAHSALSNFDQSMLDTQQVFKPYAADLEQNGYSVIPDPSGINACHYETVLLLATKNQRESENLLARCVSALKEGGLLVLAADNKSGGTRIKNMLARLGFDNISEASKNKARVAWAQKPDQINSDLLQEWLALDCIHGIGEDFVSRLGLYGWDKIDKGSKVLAAHLPRDIKGKGADFGCGYGYLSRAVLGQCRKAKSLDYIDADYRALEICALNLEGFDTKKQGLWMDLTVSQPDLSNRYDWIVMNPPFHEGKKTNTDIGAAFILNAHKSLQRKGRLFMVANRHLPYEKLLEAHFYRFETLYDSQGFKVFEAVK